MGISRRSCLGGLAAMIPLSASAGEAELPTIRVRLNAAAPEKSTGMLHPGTEQARPFAVGLGRHGHLEAGERFRGGYSLLGDFRVNAILSMDRFEMTPELVAESGKSTEWLAEHLFANMSSIDFDEDGVGGEYGHAFIGLQPLSATPQPFGFHPYKGVFRWYSYALHGTQDEARIGKCITGGCVNLGRQDLQVVLEAVQLGDLVVIEGSS